MSIILYEDNISLNEIKKINGKISLGLCCINNELNDLKKENRIYCNRTMIRKNFTVEKAKEYALKNVQDICKLIEWNEQHNIKHLRLSIDMFPHYTDEETEKYTLDFAKIELKKAGDLAKKYGHRITFHPGQFCVVGAKDHNIFEKTIKDLEMHADILDIMGIDMNGILCIHGGGIYSDKPSAINRWCKNFLQLPEKIKRRLCIENCEHSYNIKDCLEILKKL
jgi:UV DNA damage endonuclease